MMVRLGMAATAAILAIGSASAQPMVMDRKVISAEAARKIAEGCEAFAKERGLACQRLGAR